MTESKPMKEKNIYAKRDVIKLGNYFSEHMMHMTSERLHDKGEIAAELAIRDMWIDKLARSLDVCREAIKSYELTDMGRSALNLSAVTLDSIFGDDFGGDL